ncbi:MAG TPA: Ig-like domain-containing protein [Anaerolineales bacterium]|nr:Ig-like domain-containing protein [Anaerolineales bacterium]
MTKSRFTFILNGFLLLSLIIASCSGFPGISTPTPVVPTPTFLQQAAPPAIIETDPPLESVIGHLTPITFYFNQAMNQAAVEPSFNGLPPGAYVWRDESTLLYTPAQPYTPNTQLRISIGTSVQSATGFGITEPIELSFTVADFLRATNILPKADANDVNVDAAIVASFNQPVVALGEDMQGQPSAFNIQPAVAGTGEWINTSTYIFYPESSMQGGAEFSVSLNPALKTVTGVGLALSGAEGLEGSGQNAWTFVTAMPRVVELNPSAETFVPPDAELIMTFNQPMNEESVESNFLMSGNDGPVSGTFTWDDDASELTFKPENPLSRGVGYLLNVSRDAQSRGGTLLVEDYGAVLNSYPDFAVTSTEVQPWSTTFLFSSPIAEGEYEDEVTVTPAIDNLDVGVYETETGMNMYVGGIYLPDTDYIIELAGTIEDRWGQPLGDPYVLNFRTPPLAPALNFPWFYNAVFVLPDSPVLYANATNIQTADLAIEPITLQDFLLLHSSFETLQAYQPKNAVTFSQTFELQPNSAEPVEFNLTQPETPLSTGVYYVDVTSPQIPDAQGQAVISVRSRQADPAPSNGGGGAGIGVDFVVSSQVNLTFKRSAKEAFVWAVDLRTQSPVAGATVVIYDGGGNALGSGTTDSDGIWQGAINPYDGPLYAVLGAPGEETFGLAVNGWSFGFNAWDFGYGLNLQPPHTDIYLYTDRPIYRPGQTVYFRGIARQAFNGRYELPPFNDIPLNVLGWDGTQISTIKANLSPYGTFHGEIELPPDAAPGYYSLQNESLGFYFGFQVAEYRKPEINLGVEFAEDEIKLGDSTTAVVDAQYFFGAPAGEVDVSWSIYSQPAYFDLPGFQTGLLSTSWWSPPLESVFATNVNGTDQTTPQGTLSIEMPAVPESEAGQVVTLEVTVQDESDFPVSARTDVLVHPAEFYIGLRPDTWIGTANSAMGFDVFTADWARNPSGDKPLVAEFNEVEWEKEKDEFGFVRFNPVFTPLSSSNLATGPDGRARLSFVPPSAGTYMLEVSGGGTRTQVLIWVGGPGIAPWPQLENNRLELTVGKDSYTPGETATVFIPNPFETSSLALVTVERGIVFKSEVITLSGSGRQYSLPVTVDDAPNVYVTATVLGQDNQFRHGIVNLPVAADALGLNVTVTPNPTQAGPREDVTFEVQVTDYQGQPVEGEFSLSVVDLAVLALADPNARDIFPSYYSIQPLGIETIVSLSALSKPGEEGGVGGGGGGGDGGITVLREEFPDTAYWNPSLITNSEGRGQVTVTLPDSLTTWHIDVRGLTVDTKVGQTETQIISTKPLLVRPVTPRFLVAGDHLLMAAIVNNNTSNRLTATVNLQSQGFVLDEPDKATQQVDIPANGLTRVEWWGTAGPAESADLIFTATADGNPSLQDSTRPVWGALPILHYTSPQAFVTGGVLRGAATQQEVISLPKTFAPTSGGLEVEISPSLAGNLTSALEAMPEPDENSAESIVSYLIPNLEVYRALSASGLNDPKLVERVEATLNSSVSRLFYLQNVDGGWNWWGKTSPFSTGTGSDPVISAYVFFGLMRAREAGAPMNEEALQRAGAFLRERKAQQMADPDAKYFDDLAFIQFALSHAGTFNEDALNQLYETRDRMSPSGIAWLALAFNKFNAADPRAQDLISNIDASAILTSSSAHWEPKGESFLTRSSSTIYTTSTVVYALAQLDAGNPNLPNAVRYLAAHRDANRLWNVGHDNAWAILALNAAMVGLGEMRADFKFDASLNGGPLASGDIAGIQVTPFTATVPLEFLSPNLPNLLTINREDGLGRLYYNAALQLNRPVQDVKPLDKGMSIDRVYLDTGCTTGCTPLSALPLASDQLITAQLTLTLPHDAYYVMVEDFIPAGTEILDQNLKTSQQAVEGTDIQIQFDEENPFAEGWGWWLFNGPQIRDDGILFTADYLPAGTYVLTYTLTPLLAGEYRVLPARAWQAFFPEVQGTSAGMVIEIEP